jgi:hypothetical protein
MSDVTPGAPFNQLSTTGLLWLINRTVFHPRGFALALHYPEASTREEIDAGEAECTGWSLLGDGTEVWSFTEQVDDECFALVEAFLAATKEANARGDQRGRILP